MFEQGSDKPIGYVLPLRRIPTRSGTPRWTSQPWFLASKHMFLVPGDSPMGYRLPLESLPWTKPEDVKYSFDTDPFATRDKLPERPERKHGPVHSAAVADDARRPPRTSQAARERRIRTMDLAARALRRRPRDGKLYIFMPPVEYLADYLDLVAAIEDTAAHLAMPVADRRLCSAIRSAHLPSSKSRPIPA